MKEREDMSQKLYGSTSGEGSQPSLYDRTIESSGATMKGGMQVLAAMAAVAGNRIDLSMGVHTTGTQRKPEIPRNAQYKLLGSAPYENGKMY